MSTYPVRSRLAIMFSLLLALMLSILPLPELIAPFRPDWLLIILIYWAIALPHRANVGTAFVAGLLLDLLLGSVLGVRALALVIPIYLAASQFQRMRNYSVWQQAFVVGGLVMLNKLLIFWTAYLHSDTQVDYHYFWSIVSSMVFWPWIFLLLRKCRRRFSLS
ncbi:rod shape-determining protein MreD [Oceanimonas baumannii]|uniref:Rod shape-determining protein MreD n=1 Tax=Oceanimonas baumannii TaxID=129578 RepID=A0A235CIX5_9GAMM|nr:rod shape-determining protein MreD [Oceanimonas baumannii]MCC4264899.1 rod shape-determining protein MreD [Oceanimonas baumannii]OYD24561.1 rod shape-determining protein MreD [Oceanimonas baumannii]TDW59296.1 rod shape-determining protein MreD [Oceanimonas baumannii]